MTTTRAAAATILAITSAPARAFERATARYERALDSFNYEAADMQRFYPRCVIVTQEEFERQQHEAAESIYQWQRDCAAAIVALAGSYEAGMATAASHRTAPVKQDGYGFCTCDTCNAVSDLAEARKEERKSIWYASSRQECWCAACNARNAPKAPEAPKTDDVPSRWEVLGEAGADW